MNSQGAHNTHSSITDEEMMAYLNGTLSEAQRAELEERMSQEDLYTDAAEGLHALGSNDAEKMTQRINQKLATTLEKSRRKDRRNRGNKQPTFWQVVMVVLLLLFVAVVVLWMMMHR